MSDIDLGQKRKRNDSETCLDINKFDDDREKDKIDFSNLGDTMDESSDSNSDEEYVKKKIIQKVMKRAKLSPTYGEDNAKRFSKVELNHEEDSSEEFHQNPLGDPHVQDLIAKDELNSSQSESNWFCLGKNSRKKLVCDAIVNFNIFKSVCLSVCISFVGMLIEYKSGL